MLLTCSNNKYYGSAESIISNYSYIHDSKGKPVAVLSVTSLLGEVNHIIWQNTLNLFLSLSCILIAVYVLIKMAGVFLEAFRTPVLSGFVALGINLACTALGIVSGAFFSIFDVYLRKTGKKPKNI